MNVFKRTIFLILFFSTIISCRNEEIGGIKIGGTALYENSSFEENRKWCQLVEKTIKRDEKALTELVNFDCGGASGCYDLGYIITQTIYKIGEDNFSGMADNLSEKDKNQLNGFIKVGLEYYNKNKVFKTEFKDLYLILNPKS